MKKVLFIIIIALVLCFLYGKYLEPKNINIHEYTIASKDIKKSFENIKIVHFSDLLYNKDKDRLNKLKDKINGLKADVIIFSGDLFGKNYKYNESNYNELRDFLSSLNANLYKYAVIGDNDQKYLEQYKDILYDSNFDLLDNENTLFFYKDNTPINIIGITNSKDIDELFTGDEAFEFNLAVTHKPDLIKELGAYDIDVLLAGHSLGGIINIPYYGGIIKQDGARTYINDHYIVNNTNIYINNGLGFINYEFRLFNTPSINVYRFKSIEE